MVFENHHFSAGRKPDVRGPVHRHRHQTGYTLMELVIVLAIISSLAAIAWPVLMRPLSRSGVQQAGQDVRRALSEARQSAVEEGQTYQFRYQPGTSRFEVTAVDALESADPLPAAEIPLDEVSGPPPFASPLPGIDSAVQEPRLREPGFADYLGDEATSDSSSERSSASQEELQDGVVFADPEVAETQTSTPFGDEVTWEAEERTDTTDWDTQVEAEYTSEPTVEDDSGWSEPIYFHPNGRTSSARVVL